MKSEGTTGARALFDRTKFKAKRAYLVKINDNGWETEQTFQNDTDVKGRDGVGAYIIAHHGREHGEFSVYSSECYREFPGEVLS
jgi:hypothetical protein